jgi:hypothetical protein
MTFVALGAISAYQEISSIVRKNEKLLLCKNRHCGKRCFIIATGPSLTNEDLDLLKDEYTFGMNSLCLSEGAAFTPTYFGIQDHLVYAKVSGALMRDVYEPRTVFVSNRIKSRFKINPEWNVFTLNTAYHAYDRWFNNVYNSKFSDNCSRMVYDGFTITYSLMQIAAYMGFKEIYLIGADSNYPKDGKRYFIDHGIADSTLESAFERMNSAYVIARRYAEENGICIKNATRGGKLEVFERVALEDILAQPKPGA